MEQIFRTELAGRPLVIETGKMAQLANGSCLVRYGETSVLCTATASQRPRDGIDFFPLSVDYEERLYSVGKIPGSFMKREGKPSEKAVLTSRVIDRPMRPLFPKDLRNDVTLVCTVLSVEQDCSPEVCAMIGSSLAVNISDIPFYGPVGSVVVGYVNGELVLNPTEEQRKASDLYLTVAGTMQKVVMIEAGANQLPDEVVYDAIMFAHEAIKPLCAFMKDIQDKIGKAKFEYEHITVNEQMYEDIKAFCIEKVRVALDTDDKRIRDASLKVVYDEVYEHFAEQYPGSEAAMNDCLYKLQKYVVRRWLLDNHKRVDGRGIDDIRPLHAEVGLLPRVHGSGLFSRGQTQVLTIATLGMIRDQQMLDGIDNEEFKRYMHHYNFPSYSVGETKPSRGPGRREIGHGALAERALLPVIPTEEEFPYAIRLVSEVLSSNGSTSQGSVCGSTLALMDAGVPIKAPVAGISCGLISEDDKWLTMTDIQGLEDFFGDMDFKVAGTHKGITAIQMDLKVDGLTPEIIKQALKQTHDARLVILDEVMLKAIDKPRADVSSFAPKMIITQIDPDKIREVIGKGGSVIQKIVADTGAKIDIEDDGRVFISAVERDAAENALKIINSIAKPPEIGSIFIGKVTRLMAFGAFVEIAPGKEGLVHISKLDNKRVEKVEDVVQVGDELLVKVIEIDAQGRINLSRKDALADMERERSEKQPPQQ